MPSQSMQVHIQSTSSQRELPSAERRSRRSNSREFSDLVSQHVEKNQNRETRRATLKGQNRADLSERNTKRSSSANSALSESSTSTDTTSSGKPLPHTQPRADGQATAEDKQRENAAISNLTAPSSSQNANAATDQMSTPPLLGMDYGTEQLLAGTRSEHTTESGSETPLLFDAHTALAIAADQAALGDLELDTHSSHVDVNAASTALHPLLATMASGLDAPHVDLPLGNEVERGNKNTSLPAASLPAALQAVESAAAIGVNRSQSLLMRVEDYTRSTHASTASKESSPFQLSQLVDEQSLAGKHNAHALNSMGAERYTELRASMLPDLRAAMDHPSLRDMSAQSSLSSPLPRFEELLLDNANSDARVMSANLRSNAGPVLNQSAGLLNLQTPIQHGNWSQDFSHRVQLLINQDIQQAQLQIHPRHLGPIEIKINLLSDNQVNVSFNIQHAQVKDALDGALPRLRELLQEQGLNLGNVDVSQQSYTQREETHTTRQQQSDAELIAEPHLEGEYPTIAANTMDQEHMSLLSGAVDFYA